MQNRTLFFGDNLEILREKIPDETFDLIYLDPPLKRWGMNDKINLTNML